MPQLEIISPDNQKSTVELATAEYILGRDPTAVIQLVDRKVSRHHAKISYREGAYWVEDLNSANGVVVDGVLINSPTKLTASMDIEVGNFHLKFIPDDDNAKAVYQLVGLNRVAARKVFPIALGETTIGRVDGNTIVINDKSISRFHTKIIATPTEVTVEDLGSSNGTFIDRQPTNGVTPIAVGQRLRIGSVELLFQPIGGMKRVSLKETLQEMDRLYLATLGIVLGLLFMIVLLITVIVGKPQAPKLNYSVLDQIEREMANKLAQGAKNQAQSNWDLAIATYEDILNMDPLNKEASSRLKTTQAEQGYGQNLAQAQQLLKRDDAKTAQELLMGIPATSFYYENARRVLMEANSKLAELYYSQAYKMYKKNKPDYKAIHDKLIEHLTLDPTSDKGKKLVTEIETKLRSDGTDFISYQQQLEAIAGKSQKLVTKEVIDKLNGRYGNKEIVNILTAYIGGDIERTKNDLNNVVGANTGKAKELLTQLTEMEQYISEGQNAKLTGNIERAIAAWERSIKIESNFLPEGVQSRTIRNIKHSMAGELFTLGEKNFKKQLYTDAFDNWYRGHNLDKSNTEIMGGIAKLDNLAKSKLIEAQNSTGASACDLYKLVLNITMADSQWHKKAQEQAAKCN